MRPLRPLEEVEPWWRFQSLLSKGLGTAGTELPLQRDLYLAPTELGRAGSEQGGSRRSWELA